MKTLLEQAYLVQYTNATTKHHSTRFGICEENCPECNRPFLRFMNVDTRDEGLGLQALPFHYLPLYYCYLCRMCLGDLYYRLALDGSIISFNLIKETTVGEPYTNVISTISESGVLLVALTPEEQAYYTNRGDAFECKCRPELLPELSKLHMNQIGGYPWLYDNWDSYNFICPICEQKMPYLAKFNTSTPDGNEICGDFDTPELIFTFCSKCLVVGAKHRNYC